MDEEETDSAKLAWVLLDCPSYPLTAIELRFTMKGFHAHKAIIRGRSHALTAQGTL